MNHPDQSDRKGQLRAGRTLRVRQASPKDSPRLSDNRKEQQGIDDMDCDVDQTIASDVQAAERVVDCEGDADEGTSGQRRALLGRGQRRGEMPDLLVDDDRVLVVERERGREGVPVNGEAGDDQDKRGFAQLLPVR